MSLYYMCIYVYVNTLIQIFIYSIVIYVNFSQTVYSAEEVDGMMIVTLQADGFSIWPYSVEVNPMETGGQSKLVVEYII